MTTLSPKIKIHVMPWKYIHVMSLLSLRLDYPRGRVDSAIIDLFTKPSMKTPLSQILDKAVFCIALFATSAWAAERNPPGDIPDDQVFVPYTSAAGSYSLKVPEGWARSEKGSDVDFIDKFDGVAVIIVNTDATPPRIHDVVARLVTTEKGFNIVSNKQLENSYISACHV